MAIFSRSQHKTLEPINTEIGVIDYLIEVTKCAKYGQHRSGGLASHMGEVVGYRYFFILFFS
jgi:hypothetical protein